ncbi:MAG: zinc ribbon domain-containing protein [Gemmatimonadaceae bacterium]|nr:zinc ribbon domain-containing protein [Gemmatimonadaceae bacterium]
MDELDRLYRRLVQNIRAGFPELLTRGFEVSQLYQQIIPYRTNRRELGFDSNEEYELAVMQLLAGLRGYLSGDAELQKAMRTELASPVPELTAFRVFATSTVSLAPEALKALEKRLAGGSEIRSPASSLSPTEQAALAGRATESVEVTGEAPSVTRSSTPSRPFLATSARTPVSQPASPPASPAASPPNSALSPAPIAPLPPRATPRITPRITPRSTPLTSPLAAQSDAAMASPRSTPITVSAGDSCRYCSGTLPEGRKLTFCPNCGHNLTVQHCPACSTELEVGWKFCITCGRGVA